MKKIIVAAMTEERVIGKDGDIPWHHPEDLKRFKQLTMGSPVIMGRKTFFSLPAEYRPLPGRKNIVLSRSNPDLPQDVALAENLEDAWDEAGKAEKVFIIGGSSIYSQTLEEADRMELTLVHEEHEGDTYFPEWNEKRWIETQRQEKEQISFLSYVSSSSRS